MKTSQFFGLVLGLFVVCVWFGFVCFFFASFSLLPCIRLCLISSPCCHICLGKQICHSSFLSIPCLELTACALLQHCSMMLLLLIKTHSFHYLLKNELHAGITQIWKPSVLSDTEFVPILWSHSFSQCIEIQISMEHKIILIRNEFSDVLSFFNPVFYLLAFIYKNTYMALIFPV